MAAATVSAPYLQILVEGARSAGVPADDLLTAEVLEQIGNPDGRLGRELNNQLWTEIPRRSGDDDFGLHLAETIRPGVFVVVDYAARNAATLRQAMTRFVRYCRLVHDGSEVTLGEAGNEARVSYTLPSFPGGSPRHVAEFVVAAFYISARQMSRSELPLRNVRFQHPRPVADQEHRRIFGCEVSFGAPANEILLDRRHLDLPIAQADPKLGALLDRYAEELVARLPSRQTCSDQVRRMIAEAMCDGEHGLEPIARRLSMSPRTLQRRLQEEGTSHQQLVDDLRHEMALKYLDEPAISIGEVAFLLGFSEPSAFHRAFKRWTGATPGDYRKHR